MVASAWLPGESRVQLQSRVVRVTRGRGCVRPVRARVAVADGRARLWLSLLCPEVRFLKVCVRVSCGSRGRFSFGRVACDPMRLPDDATRISGASESCVSQ